MWESVRKFGLEYCDLPTMLWNVSVMLRVLTLNIDDRHKKPISLSSYIITLVMASAHFYVFLVSAVWFLVERCIATQDITRSIIMLSLCISTETGVVKFIYLYFNRNTLRSIVTECLNFDATIDTRSRYGMNIRKTLKKAKRRAIMFWCVIMGNAFAYVGIPFFTPGRHFMDDIFTLYGLEPMEVSPNYEFGYALVAAGVWFLCFVPANVTAVYIIMAGYIEAQMQALTQELLQMTADAEDYYEDLNLTLLKRGSFIDVNFKKRVLNEFVKMRLRDIIQKHSRNMHLLRSFEGLFRGAIFLEFFIILLGLVTELLGGLENTHLEMPYDLIHVAMDCWTGQRVLDASAQFAAAVYASIFISFYIITIFSAIAYFYVYLISGIWFVIERCIANNDIIKGIIMFSACVSSEMGPAKFIYIYCQRDTIRNIITESLRFDATIVQGSRYSKNILKTLKIAKIRAMMFWCFVMVNGTAYVATPLLTSGRHFMDGVFTIYGLEPMEKSPNCEIGYILVIAGIWFICFAPVNVSALFIFIAGYVEAHMLALTQELLHIQTDAEEYYRCLNLTSSKSGSFVEVNYKKRVINKFVTMRLHDIIEKHSKSIYLLQSLEGVFRGATAIEFILLVMGLIAELLGGLENTYLEMPSDLIHVAMDCWTGQRVLDASAQFAAAVYACNWETFEVTNMKSVMLMLTSARKPMALTVGGVTMLNFECLMIVYKFIYSAYTTLQSTLK